MRRLRVFTVGIVLASCSRLTSPAPLPAELSTISNGTPLSVSHSYKRLYSFHLAPPPDGLWPTTGLTYFRGLLYGTTYGGGGTASGPCKAGCGTVFSIGTSGTDERMVYKFAGAPDGAIPEAGLSDIDGALYGTTFYGGVTRCTGRGCGTVFKIDASGHESVIYSFKGGADGANPAGALTVVNGTIYGTTTSGLNGRACAGQRTVHGTVYGTVFALTRSGSSYIESVLHAFMRPRGASDGACPIGSLVVANGNLYGVTYEGGTHDAGTIFELRPNGKHKILHSFAYAEGDYPVGLALANGTLYGAASAAGTFRRGSLFSIGLDGSSFRVLHFFGGHSTDGALPYAAPILLGEKLYGTTEGGGDQGIGTVYELKPGAKASSYTEALLYSFLGYPVSDGAAPVAPLTEVKGVLYGTTVKGGQNSQSNSVGTVFKISP
jgi:uncharacterized repeat protein (TIGR03803 family)